MRTADVGGSLRGSAPQVSDITEGMFLPLYERVLSETGVAAGSMVLDVGCGPGLAAHLAARRGALVSGLDAAKPSVAIAQARTKNGDFRVGKMEDLPWIDSTFDVVTGFNSFQFASNPIDALREAKRVTRPSGRLAMAVWGPDDQCETTATMSAIFKLLPIPPPKRELPAPLAMPGRLEDLMVQAGLEPLKTGDVTCSFVFPDLERAVQGIMSSGDAMTAVKRVGAQPVRRAITESLEAFRTPGGGYRQRNTFRYTIASPMPGNSEVD